MRKIFAILVICAIMLLSACQQAELPQSTEPPVQITASSSYVEESKEPEKQEATESTNASSQPVITEPLTTETTVLETTTTTEETKPKQTEPAQTATEKPASPVETKSKEPEVTKPPEPTDTGKVNEPVPTDPVPEERVPTTTKPPVVEDEKPTTPPPTESVKPEETEPTEPEFDINYWIDYAKSYAQSKGLILSEAAIDCWDNPIGAGAHCIYLERDIQSRLNRYAKDEDITDVWIWAEATGNGRYDLYIGYA